MTGYGSFRIVELMDGRDINLLNKLIARYHKQGNNPGLAKPRYFVLIEERNGIEYWVAGAILHSPQPFAQALLRYGVNLSNSYFIRRICNLCPCNDYLVVFLRMLAERIKDECESLITFGLDEHTNKQYEQAGFKKVGITKSGKPIYILKLRTSKTP